MTLKTILHKINNRWTKLCFQPIRVFVFHQVSDTFDESTMWPCDWTQTEQFKRNILALKEQYTFISLTEAHEHLCKDKFRFHKYAVLTADDGWASLNNILLWLAEQQIPLTLFLNPGYFDGSLSRENGMNKLLHRKEIDNLQTYPLLTIGSHGWTHQLVTEQSADEFRSSVLNSIQALQHYLNYVQFFAYPCGRHTADTDVYLHKLAHVPVYCDGAKNYNNPFVIHREPIDGAKYV